MGAPCTGKTTKYAEVFDRINGEYESEVITTEHINRKNGKLKSKDMGFYFPAINLMFIGSHNKRGELQGLDVITYQVYSPYSNLGQILSEGAA